MGTTDVRAREGVGRRWSLSALACVALGGCHDFDALRASDGGSDTEAAVEAGMEGGAVPDPIRPSFVSPKNLAAALAGTREIILEGGVTALWDVESGELQVKGEDEPRFTQEPLVESQGDGMPELAVFPVARLVVSSNATLQFAGPHAVVLSAREGIDIAGTVTVGAKGGLGGPGGATSLPEVGELSFPVSGQQGPKGGNDLVNAYAYSGAGGGGNGAPGGSGGFAWAKNGVGSAASALGGPGGAAWADVSDWDARAALVGGGAGGPTRCGVNFEARAQGGGGGGALLLASQRSIVLRASGRVSAPGAGGPAPVDAANCEPDRSVAGAGGGAGGTLVLEAPRVEIAGTVAANGGGGAGSGRNALAVEASRGKVGTDGQPGIQVAGGGAAGANHDSGDGYSYRHSAGGSGGAAGASLAPGAEGVTLMHMVTALQSISSISGGGGGGAGRIEIRTASGVRDAAWVLSPSDAPQVIVEQVMPLAE
ncbi:MAG: hypothetical protein R3A78_02855 [Polyangiales bacterium]